MVSLDSILDQYMSTLAKTEGGNNPYIKNPQKGQTASGLYQFTKATWQSLGGSWGNDPSQAFGGLRPTVEEQNARMREFTRRNAIILAKNGFTPTVGTLSLSHFLGTGGALNLLRANPNAPSSIAGRSAVSANKAIFAKNPTVRDLINWAERHAGGGGGEKANKQNNYGPHYNTSPQNTWYNPQQGNGLLPSYQNSQMQPQPNGLLNSFQPFKPLGTGNLELTTPTNSVQGNTGNQNSFNLLHNGVTMPYGGEGVFKKLGMY